MEHAEEIKRRMKVLKNSATFKDKGVRDPVVTLGNFDGIHLGHQRILGKICERAEKLKTASVVYTFDPHPLKVVAPDKSPPLLLDSEDKISVIEGFGVDFLVLARFTREFAAKHPGEFAEEVLVRGLGVREVWVGEDFSFGRGRSGSVSYLKAYGKRSGFKVHAVPPRKRGGTVISSSRIRELITDGEVKKAAALLGRPYAIKGTVVAGRAIGHAMGFPTANIEVTSELLPAEGVYAVYGAFDGKRYKGVVNIGTAPTFGKKEKTVEAHLLGFTGDIYGKKVRLHFAERLRDERAFASKDALVVQIKRDTERAERILRDL